MKRYPKLADSKIVNQAYYVALPDGVERTPTTLHTFHAHPLIMTAAHWHAQVEINYIVKGWARYKMASHEVTFTQGDLAMFWGGQPHWLCDGSHDLVYAGAHLPLVHFFRLRLSSELQSRLMMGSTLVTRETDASDPVNFARWDDYARSGDAMKASIAVDELLLRIERIGFSPFQMLPEGKCLGGMTNDQHASPLVVRICEYISQNFREDIDSIDIAVAADVHPKYAMTVFKKSTGMTLNDYIILMRLSYAQAKLMRDEESVLTIAMDSGFGSLSAFNKAFRKVAGMAPSDFRREVRSRPQVAPNAQNDAVYASA